MWGRQRRSGWSSSDVMWLQASDKKEKEKKNSWPNANRLWHSDVTRTREASRRLARTGSPLKSFVKKGRSLLGSVCFSVLSSLPTPPQSTQNLPPFLLPSSVPEIALPLRCLSGVFYLLCVDTVQTRFPSIFLPWTRPLTFDHHFPTDGETLSPARTHCSGLLLLKYGSHFTLIQGHPAGCEKFSGSTTWLNFENISMRVYFPTSF